MKRLLLLSFLVFILSVAFATEFTIGTGTSTQNFVPFCGYYDFSWSKVIFTKAEINAAGLSNSGEIHAISFYVGNSPSNYTMTDQRLFIRHTTLAVYGAATDETGTAYPNNAGFSQVFQGDIVYNGGGWKTIIFSSAFNWNNADNIEILYENWDGDYTTGYPSFSYTSTEPNYCAVYKNADNAFPAIDGTRYYNRPNIRLGVFDSSLPSPAILRYPLENGWAFTDAQLSWGDGGGFTQSYDVYLDTFDGSTLVSNNQTGTTYSATLTAGARYYWKVIPRNSIGTASDCPIWNFRTPTTSQLAESFESDVFPPVGWTNPSSFYSSTYTPFHGIKCTYKSATTTPAMIYTPILSIDEGSELNFVARTSSSTDVARIRIKYSLEGSVWHQVGDLIQLPASTAWNNYIIDLNSLEGLNCYLGFEVFSIDTSVSVYIDHIFGPEIAPVVPGSANLVFPSSDTYLIQNEALSWSAGSPGGIPSSYDIYLGTTSNPPFVSNQTGTTYIPVVEPGTTYYWKVVPRNSAGTAVDCPVWGFKTPASNQLNESFEAITFPPPGWANPGSWTINTTYHFHGNRAVKKTASTTASILSTPLLSMTANSALEFCYQASNANGYGQIKIKYSTDRSTWTQLGSTIAISSGGWNRVVRALNLLAGNNYYLAFEVSTTSATQDISHIPRNLPC